jgi:hypothetical protein
VTIGSVPAGAAVLIDGVQVGTTPLIGHPLSYGPHRITLEGVDGAAERQIVIDGSRRTPVRFVWREGRWESGYE